MNSNSVYIYEVNLWSQVLKTLYLIIYFWDTLLETISLFIISIHLIFSLLNWTIYIPQMIMLSIFLANMDI